MQISKINYNLGLNNRIRNSNTQPPMEPKDSLQTNTLAFDTVNFQAKKKEVYKNYSCKDADMLKYDLEYTKPSYFRRNYEIYGDDIELTAKNKVGGAQVVSGNAYDESFQIKIDSGVFGVRKGEVTGTVEGKKLNVAYMANENAKSIKLSGNFEDFNDKNKALIIMLINDKVKHDLRAEQEMEMAMIATVLS